MTVGLVIGQLTYGGAEGQLYELARGLEAPWRPIVYCLSNAVEPYGSKLREAGIEVRSIPARVPMDPTRVWRLAAAMKEDGVGVAHAFLFIASAYTYLATRLARGVRLVTSARNCKLEKSRIRRMIMRRSFRAADAVIANSAEMSRFASLYYDSPSTRSHVVYNGVDLARFSGAVKEPGGSLVIGTVGRLHEQKNYEGFLEAAARVLQARPDARFRIVGKGPERENLEAYAAELGIDASVDFLGTTDDVPGFLADVDQFWLTSDWEGTPNVVLEAMAAGKPVLATRVGGTPEVVTDESTGMLVEKGDMQGIADCSLRIAEDPELAARLSASARRNAEARFSLPAMISETTRVYREALGGADA